MWRSCSWATWSPGLPSIIQRSVSLHQPSFELYQADLSFCSAQTFASSPPTRSTSNSTRLMYPSRCSTLLVSSTRFIDPFLATSTSSWSHFINPTTLPSLHTVKLLRLVEMHFAGVLIDESTPTNDLTKALLSLAPQLEVLAIFEHVDSVIAQRLSAEDWRSFAELQDLTIMKLSTFASTPSSIPSKLKRLVAIVPDGTVEHEEYEELQRLIAGWEGGSGRTVILKREAEVDVDDYNPEAVERARQSKLRSAEERGIDVNEVVVPGFVEDWQNFFNIW